MYGFFITMMSLMNQEITESYPPAIPTTFGRLKVFCSGCSKQTPAFKCSVYPSPAKLMWFRNNQQCAFNFKVLTKVPERKVNALKASKRAAKGNA